MNTNKSLAFLRLSKTLYYFIFLTNIPIKMKVPVNFEEKFFSLYVEFSGKKCLDLASTTLKRTVFFINKPFLDISITSVENVQILSHQVDSCLFYFIDLFIYLFIVFFFVFFFLPLKKLLHDTDNQGFYYHHSD